MKAEIISIGTELLLGEIINTNASYLSQELAKLGIGAYRQTVVGDNPERIKEALALAFKENELVITTGGLGPTEDDLTKEIVADYFNLALELDEESLLKIKEIISRYRTEVTRNNYKQAYFPQNSIILTNNNGTAPGCIINEEGKIAILLPGPPSEMQAMFMETVIPFLKNFTSGIIFSRVLKISGIGESNLDEILADLFKISKNPTLSPYAGNGECRIRITASAANENGARDKILPLEEEVRRRLGDNIYGTDSDTLESVIGELLITRQLTIAAAESCTGGLLAARLINYPGISAVFKEGVITYSNQSKMDMLGVRGETLQTYGAVSSRTAGEMAQGIAIKTGSNIGISTTGIAGPGGGTPEKPVGLVYLGLYINNNIITKKLTLGGERNKIRERSVVFALDMLRRELIKL